MTKWIDRVNLPQEEGFHWARTSGHDWWNCIACVHGDAPFLKVDVWIYLDDRLVANANVYDIEEFGPKIERPEKNK